jgi:hypothetical protein
VSNSHIVVSSPSISELAESHLADLEFERCSERFSKTTLESYSNHPKILVPESGYGNMDVGPTLITASAPFPGLARYCVVLYCIALLVRVHCGGDGGGSDTSGEAGSSSSSSGSGRA